MATARHDAETSWSHSGGGRLTADIGGTHARFASVGASPRDLRGVEILRCADYPDLGDALGAYRRRNGLGDVREVCVAVAAPVGHDRVELPNSHWGFSVAALSRQVGAPLRVINDFTAQALAVDVLEPDELTWIGSPRPATSGARAIIGPGTGLGVAVQAQGGEVLPSEGGHAGFAPADEHQSDLLRVLRMRYPRVSVERVVSGPGLENLYWANRVLAEAGSSTTDAAVSAERIVGMACAGDAMAVRAVHDFFDILAGFSGDVALLALARRGVYLSGGVMRRLAGLLDVGRFRARFEEKGRLAALCRTMSLAWIDHEYPGLLGCAVALHQNGSVPGVAEAFRPR